MKALGTRIAGPTQGTGLDKSPPRGIMKKRRKVMDFNFKVGWGCLFGKCRTLKKSGQYAEYIKKYPAAQTLYFDNGWMLVGMTWNLYNVLFDLEDRMVSICRAIKEMGPLPGYAYAQAAQWLQLLEWLACWIAEYEGHPADWQKGVWDYIQKSEFFGRENEV